MVRVRNPAHVQKLQALVDRNLPSIERHHVLLGQTLFDTVVSVQVRDAFLICQDGCSRRHLPRTSSSLDYREA